MTIAKTLIRSALLATALIAAPALADGPIAERGEAAERTHFERDRETILSMAGDYKVRFDMQESTPWMEGYEPLERKISGGHESVRVIEDTGAKIVLQHLLVAEALEGVAGNAEHRSRQGCGQHRRAHAATARDPDHFTIFSSLTNMLAQARSIRSGLI